MVVAIDKDQMILELQQMLERSYQRERMASILEEVTGVAGHILTDETTISRSSTISKASALLLSPEGVYEQLLDMQFERLLAENAQLKVRLTVARLQQKQQKSTEDFGKEE